MKMWLLMKQSFWVDFRINKSKGLKVAKEELRLIGLVVNGLNG